MPSPNWNDDDELMRDVRQALRPEPIDERILDAARAAFAWRTVDAELELIRILYDSQLEEAVGVRGRPPSIPRTLVFQDDDLGVEIEISDAGIEGQLIPPGPGEVSLQTAEGTPATTTADEVGCFAFPTPSRGPIRLECSLGTRRFTTQWITI
ncbi:MAG TPA: hypothetical protein VFR67_05730 [Pilimelia sp.]|nr:hypothetical protein [Pilimelia sp.]